jgi:hypothetical protein
MAKVSKAYRIGPEGELVGLWDDKLAGLGQPSISRASNVEFDNGLSGWRVEILVGPDAGTFLPGIYTVRKDALKAEVAYLTELIRTNQI